MAAKESPLRFVLKSGGGSPFDKTIPKFSEQGQIYMLRSTFTEIWKLLNFGKANHSAENSVNSGMKIKWNRNFQDKNYFPIFLFSASSFGFDHSELAISRKGDGDA